MYFFSNKKYTVRKKSWRLSVVNYGEGVKKIAYCLEEGWNWVDELSKDKKRFLITPPQKVYPLGGKKRSEGLDGEGLKKKGSWGEGALTKRDKLYRIRSCIVPVSCSTSSCSAFPRLPSPSLHSSYLHFSISFLFHIQPAGLYEPIQLSSSPARFKHLSLTECGVNYISCLIHKNVNTLPHLYE